MAPAPAPSPSDAKHPEEKERQRERETRESWRSRGKKRSWSLEATEGGQNPPSCRQRRKNTRTIFNKITTAYRTSKDRFEEELEKSSIPFYELRSR